MDYLTIAFGGTALMLSVGGVLDKHYQFQTRKILKSIRETIHNCELPRIENQIRTNKLERGVRQ